MLDFFFIRKRKPFTRTYKKGDPETLPVAGFTVSQEWYDEKVAECSYLKKENDLLHYQLDMAIAKQLELQTKCDRLRDEVEQELHRPTQESETFFKFVDEVEQGKHAPAPKPKRSTKKKAASE